MIVRLKERKKRKSVICRGTKSLFWGARVFLVLEINTSSSKNKNYNHTHLHSHLQGHVDEGGAPRDIEGTDISTEPVLCICMHMCCSYEKKHKKADFKN